MFALSRRCRRDRMRMRSALTLGLAALIIGILMSGNAAAHAEFVSSDPAPSAILSSAPSLVRITVSEAVQPSSPSIFVANVTGVRFDEGPTSLNESAIPSFSVALRAAGSGIYTVTWRAISADDGHFSAGSFYFVVTNPDGSLPGSLPGSTPVLPEVAGSPVEVAIRFASFAGLAAALGAAISAGLIWTPAIVRSRMVPPVDIGNAYAEGARRLLVLGLLGSTAFTGAIAAWWFAVGDSAGLLESTFLASLLARLVFGVFLVADFSLLTLRSRTGHFPRPMQTTLWVAIVLGAGAVGAGSIATHGAAAQGWRPLGGIADAAHTLGASMWVGGLMAFVRLRPWLRSEREHPYSLTVLRRLSRFALVSIVMVLGAGIVLGLALVGSWEALVGSEYGWAVLGKISLSAPMLALGAYNRYRLASPPDDAQTTWFSVLAANDGERDLVPRIARNVRVEASLGVVILVLAGFLGATSPPSSPSFATPSSGTFTRQATNASLLVELSVFPYPTVPGRYVFDIQVWYAANRTPYIRPQNGTVNLTLLEGGQISVEAPFTWSGINHFFVDTTAMYRPGTWRIDLPLTAPDGTEAHFLFYVQLQT